MATSPDGLKGEEGATRDRRALDNDSLPDSAPNHDSSLSHGHDGGRHTGCSSESDTPACYKGPRETEDNQRRHPVTITRHDVSQVRHLGAYAAKQCPVVVQWDVLEPADRAPTPPFLQAIFDAGNLFEEEIVASLADADGDWVFIDRQLPYEEAAEQTMAAIAEGAPVVVDAVLPRDDAGRRAGKPDLIVREGSGYVPVDIKSHLVLKDEGGGVLVSEIDAPFPVAARVWDEHSIRRNKSDALQLAHYRRMLEAIGHASDSPMGGILGKEGVVAWYDLDELLWSTPAKSDGKRRRTRSTMDVYDFEFGFRLDIAAVSAHHASDPSVDLLVVPLKVDECTNCEWRHYCGPIYTAGSGDPSLLPSISFEPWRQLRDAGIVDRAGVAGLHYPTARLAADGVDVEKVLNLAAAAPGEAPIADLIPRATKQRSLLADAGITTAGAARAALDARTAAITGRFLPSAILDARAALGPEPLYRLPGSTVQTPRFDIEVDLDMENTFTGEVYLWGALLTDGSTGAAPEYRPFVDWSAEPDEVALATGLLDWLDELAAGADAKGLTIGVFFWTEAETRELRRIAADEAVLAERVERLAASPGWVDLHAVCKSGWTSGGSYSLKAVATALDHLWPVDDPDGGVSMIKHREAIDGDNDAREWLLAYNRGDVEATLAVRAWLDGPGEAVPEVAIT